MPLNNASLCEFTPVNEEELERILSKSPTKSCSLDPLPTWMLKQLTKPLLPLMTKIINMSLSTGQVPSSMKEARITPLLKKSSLDPDNLKNHRSVSNLPFLYKILEKVVASRLKHYMDVNQLYDPMQSAYRSGHSTETALTKVLNDMLVTMDNQGVAILVMLDLSAAFDTVDHKVLLQRMKDIIGVNGLVLKWFESYLSERTQRIQINDKLSKLICLIFGVPQGSVLGPLLFLIYMLPLHHLILSHGLKMHGYADDTQLYLSFTNPTNPDAVQHGCEVIERCLMDIHSWMTENKLKLNSNKTEIILFGTRVALSRIKLESLNVAGTRILLASGTVKNLGVECDATLTMESQVNKVVKAANLQIRNIGNVRRKLDMNSTKILVHSLVISRLDYGNSLLCGISNKLLARLQSVQNKAARLIKLTRKYEHITPVLMELHWLPISVRAEFKLMLLVYKALNGLAPQYIRGMLYVHQPVRNLRSSSMELLKVPKSRLKTIGDRAFSIHAPRIWNNLPAYIRQSDSVTKFKSQMKTYYYTMTYSHLM